MTFKHVNILPQDKNSVGKSGMKHDSRRKRSNFKFLTIEEDTFSYF